MRYISFTWKIFETDAIAPFPDPSTYPFGDGNRAAVKMMSVSLGSSPLSSSSKLHKHCLIVIENTFWGCSAWEEFLRMACRVVGWLDFSIVGLFGWLGPWLFGMVGF